MEIAVIPYHLVNEDKEKLWVCLERLPTLLFLHLLVVVGCSACRCEPDRIWQLQKATYTWDCGVEMP